MSDTAKGIGGDYAPQADKSQQQNENPPKTVKFNVGGTKYEVSTSLLDRYPSSMLAIVSSERWAQEGSNDEIFIERNGLRFQYVLDYMRESSVQLPLSVPRALFVADLEYFALDFSDSSITLSVADPKDLFHSINGYQNFFQEKLENIDSRFKLVAAEKLAFTIAKKFFSQLFHTDHTKESDIFAASTIGIAYSPCFENLTLDDLRQDLTEIGLNIEKLTYNDRYNCSVIRATVSFCRKP